MTQELTPDIVREFFRRNAGYDVTVRQVQDDLDIQTTKGKNNLKQILRREVESGTVRHVGYGKYRGVKKFDNLRWWEVSTMEPFEFGFPMGDDFSSFGFEETLLLYPGDIVVVGGVSQAGKTAIVLNMLRENADRHKCLLMGSELATADGKISPRTLGRLNRMDWDWMNEARPKFDLLPVREHYEDYIDGQHDIYFIDWINITDNFFLIGKVMDDIHANSGQAISVIVLQKSEDAKLARGRDFSRDLASCYLTIDILGNWQSRLTVVKAKSPKGTILDGRTWGFEIVDGGSRLHNIREMTKCRYCWAKGYTARGECEHCDGKGYIDK